MVLFTVAQKISRIEKIGEFLAEVQILERVIRDVDVCGVPRLLFGGAGKKEQQYADPMHGRARHRPGACQAACRHLADLRFLRRPLSAEGRPHQLL